MGVIAWIALGVAGGLRANILLPGKRSRGLIFIGLTCFAGVLGGGWTPDYRGCRRHRAAPGGPPALPDRIPTPPRAAAANGAAVKGVQG